MPASGTGYCNGCANHCPLTAMQCAKGMAMAGQEIPEDLPSLLNKCSNKLYRFGRNQAYFDVLKEKKKLKLKDYLTRLLLQ